MLEALAAAAPGWLATVGDTEPWSRRYAARIDSWRLPVTASKRAGLAVAFGTDAVTLLEAVCRADMPGWLRELPAVQALRTVLVQNYQVYDTPRGREVRRREADKDGLPPARVRLGSPYDTDARWAARGEDLFWLGYKIHLSGTCDGDDGDNPAPNLITNVATASATVPDASMTEPVHQALAGRQLAPGKHYADSGYPSAALVASSLKDFATVLISPLLGDCSPQARAGGGYDRAASGDRTPPDTTSAACATRTPRGALRRGDNAAGRPPFTRTADTPHTGQAPAEASAVARRTRRAPSSGRPTRMTDTPPRSNSNVVPLTKRVAPR